MKLPQLDTGGKSDAPIRRMATVMTTGSPELYLFAARADQWAEVRQVLETAHKEYFACSAEGLGGWVVAAQAKPLAGIKSNGGASADDRALVSLYICGTAMRGLNIWSISERWAAPLRLASMDIEGGGINDGIGWQSRL